ncbi:hypothetical protein, partial [Cryobacterium sp. MLB-32]|uniref:hypothetical protein n=1 Tax=Cryobacterium sp. MLB-32 TaxID=1529318 RepID=UPI001E3A076B
IPTRISSESRLRSAMQRLLNGKALFTDGTLSKKNLYTEAQVSRATMNREKEVLAEWDSFVGSVRTPHPSDTTSREVQTDKAALRDATRALRETREQLSAAIMLIASLHRDNDDLRRRVHSRTATGIVPIGRRTDQGLVSDVVNGRDAGTG